MISATFISVEIFCITMGKMLLFVSHDTVDRARHGGEADANGVNDVTGLRGGSQLTVDTCNSRHTADPRLKIIRLLIFTGVPAPHQPAKDNPSLLRLKPRDPSDFLPFRLAHWLGGTGRGFTTDLCTCRCNVAEGDLHYWTGRVEQRGARGRETSARKWWGRK